MNRKGIRHNRIIELRAMALKGCSLEELKTRCMQYGISKPTMNNYIDEVVTSLQKIRDRNATVL